MDKLRVETESMNLRSMKLLNLSILLLLASSCVFSVKPDGQALQMDELAGCVNAAHRKFIRDSVKVDVTIGDYQVFYRISEYEHPKNISREADENRITDKIILLNIQKTDTTSVVAYKTMDINDFTLVLKDEKAEDYFIDSFGLKEVTRDSVVFIAKLCMFDGDLVRNVDLTIKDNGMIIYSVTV